MSWRRRRKKTSIAFKLCWAAFSKDSMPDTLMEDPHESDDSVDHSEKNDGKATDSYPHSNKKVESFTAHATNWDALLDANGIPTDGTPPDPLQSERMAEQMGVPSLEDQEQGLAAGTPPGGAGSTPPGLSPAPPGAHEKAAQKRRAGRGVEGVESPSQGPGSGPSTPPGLSPAPPGAHEKAAQKRRAGRGVEGEEDATPGPAPVPSAPPGLPSPPPGAHEKAAQKRRAGRGIEGEEGAGLGCSVGPSNPMDNPETFDWDSLAIPGQPPLPSGGH